MARLTRLTDCTNHNTFGRSYFFSEEHNRDALQIMYSSVAPENLIYYNVNFPPTEPDNIRELMERERIEEVQKERIRSETDAIERLYEQRHQFIMKYGLNPNTVFLNRADHYSISRSTHHNMYNTCFGMKVVPTIAEESYVGLVLE